MTAPVDISFRLDRIELLNFRCFAKCALDLDPKTTVFVAENAQGKTALLDAIARALDVYVSAIAYDRHSHGFDREDIHRSSDESGKIQPRLPARFIAEGVFNNSPIRWGVSLKGAGLRARNSRGAATQFYKAVRSVVEPSAQGAAPTAPPSLPLTAFYGTGRLWSEHKLTKGKRTIASMTPGRMSAFADCLSSSSSFKTFTAWYGASMEALKNPALKGQDGEQRPERLLAAVREAVRTVLAPTGWSEIDWEFSNGEHSGLSFGRGQLVVEHATRGRFPLPYLSDGVRNMIALTADLAHRCVRLNPHLGEDAARLTPGILLIDEVDMHLHPRWQQLIVGLLGKAFPAMQMILTTHSPHVLSTVFVNSIRVIRLREGEGIVEKPKYQTRGVESADVLANIMGVDPVPQVEEATWLHNYRALVQAGDFHSELANQQWLRLVNHFGPEHPVLNEVEMLKRLYDFKRANNIQGGAV